MKVLIIVLLVEDDPMYVKVYGKKFADSGFEVRFAKDGEEGLKMALEEHPDLVLLDLMMPKMDGMTMMKNLRQDAWGKGVPIIILTNLDANDKILQGVVEDQPAYYIMKANSTPEDILEKAKQILKPPKLN